MALASPRWEPGTEGRGHSVEGRGLARAGGRKWGQKISKEQLESLDVFSEYGTEKGGSRFLRIREPLSVLN